MCRLCTLSLSEHTGWQRPHHSLVGAHPAKIYNSDLSGPIPGLGLKPGPCPPSGPETNGSLPEVTDKIDCDYQRALHRAREQACNKNLVDLQYNGWGGDEGGGRQMPSGPTTHMPARTSRSRLTASPVTQLKCATTTSFLFEDRLDSLPSWLKGVIRVIQRCS